DGIRDFHVTGVQTCALPIFVQKPIGKTSVVIVLKIEPFELGVDIRDRSTIIFKILEEDGRLYFKIVPSILSETVPRIHIIISKCVGFMNRVELSKVFVQNVRNIQAQVKPTSSV